VQVVPTRMHAKKGKIKDVRQPEQGEPQSRVVIRKRPFHTGPVQALLDIVVSGQEQIVVVIQEFVVPHLSIDQDGQDRNGQQQEKAGPAFQACPREQIVHDSPEFPFVVIVPLEFPTGGT